MMQRLNRCEILRDNPTLRAAVVPTPGSLRCPPQEIILEILSRLPL